MTTHKGLVWCPVCTATIAAYNKAVAAGDRTAALAALDKYLDHRRDDMRHIRGSDFTSFARERHAAGVAACRAVLARTPNRAVI